MTLPLRKRFGAPVSSRTRSKRARTTTLPKAAQKETKQKRIDGLSTSFADTCYESLPLSLTPGSGGNELIGSKLRIKRIRVNYDFTTTTGISLTQGVRIALVIPKDPSSNPFVPSNRGFYDFNNITVLKERLLPLDNSKLAGTMDFWGPINIELDVNQSQVRKNNIFVHAYSVGNGAALAARIAYEFFYED